MAATDIEKYRQGKKGFTRKIRALDRPMVKILEYEAADLPIGDSRLLEIAWKIKKAGEYGEKWYSKGEKAGAGIESQTGIKRHLHLLEYWSTALKEIFETRRRRAIAWFPLYETAVLNSEPILTAEDRIQQAFREEQHSEALNK